MPLRYWLVLMVFVLAIAIYYTYSNLVIIKRVRDSVRGYVMRKILYKGELKTSDQGLEQSGFFGLLKQSRLYWISTIITAILCYGFTLTNYTMFVDDLAFKNYFERHSLLAAGRWGYLILMKLFNTYFFLPFWRAFIGMCLILTGSTFLCGLYRKYSVNRFDSKAATIFTCIAISFPQIAYLFYITSATVAIGFLFILTGVSLFFACKWIIEKKCFLYIIPSALLLGYAAAFYEPSMVLFLIGAFSLILVHFLYTAENGKFISFLVMAAKVLFIAIIGVAVWKVGAVIWQYLLSVDQIYYTENFANHDTSSVMAFIRSLAGFTNAFIRSRNFPPGDGNIINIVIWWSTVILVVVSVLLSIVIRKPSVFLAGTATAISAYGMYFILGSVTLLNRFTFTFSIMIAFTVALMYLLFRNCAFKRVKMKYLIIFLTFWLVFVQSREMNQVFHLDYQRYQRDVTVMNTIVHDLDCEPNKPLLFVGYLPDPLPHIELVGVSLFNINRPSPTMELNASIISAFFKAHYFPINLYGGDVDLDELSNQTTEMPGWPQKGYIKELEYYVIVKLG